MGLIFMPKTATKDRKDVSLIKMDRDPKVTSNAIMRTDCKMCNCEDREEAEQIWEKTKKVSIVHRFIKDEKGHDINYTSVRNHLYHHYEALKNEELVQEYDNHIDQWMTRYTDPELSLMRRIAVLDREATVLSAMSEGQSLDERRKIAETVSRLSNTILAFQSKLQEIQKDKEPVRLIVQQLQVIIQEEASNTNQEVRGHLLNVLEKLGENEELKNLIISSEEKSVTHK